MDRMPGWPRHFDAGLPISPVILPMGSPRNPIEETRPDLALGGMRRAAKVKQFAFPAIPPWQEESSLDELPLAIWPKCDCTEAMQAGVRLAKAVCCRLPANRSSVLALTSPGDGDGKTTLAELLAPELAKRTVGGVLAVDADFRRADLTARLAIPTNGASVGPSAIYPTDLAGLSVLPMSSATRCISTGSR